ncbi:MAG TPA: DUF3108 domain-containing protein [Pseudolabrys sp.]|jgi:hypothetical protein|nr:DUF3108 domain-containing protein [Pseudolabrys sp.]
MFRPPHHATASLLGVLALLLAATPDKPARAQGKVKAHYTISMTGVTFGEIVWLIDIGDTLYTTTASGKASGVLSKLVNGEGSVAAQGNIAADRLLPSLYTSTITDDDGRIKLQMTFAGGAATETMTPQPPEYADRLPVTDADRRGITDPLSAVLISTKLGGGTLAASDCNHTLKIFDGRRRYNLALSYDRIDKVAIERGYSGPILVCGVVLQPIAGYRADSMMVKYVAGRRDMELWFAPIAGTSIMAPVRVLMPTLIGTLRIQADQFEAAASAHTPVPVETSPLPPPR